MDANRERITPDFMTEDSGSFENDNDATSVPSRKAARSGGSVSPVRGAHSVNETAGRKKASYSIACASAFRDAVTELAERRKVNVGDLARSMILAFPAAVIDTFPDPGEPPSGDREEIILKSGPSAGKPWRRKPRLQVRMPSGFDPLTLRKALGLALALDRGEYVASVGDDGMPERRSEAERLRSEVAALKDSVRRQKDEADRLRAAMTTLMPTKLKHGVRRRSEALFVLGFAPDERPGPSEIKGRYRMLATVHHPDSGIGDNGRMAELNQAYALLRRD